MSREEKTIDNGDGTFSRVVAIGGGATSASSMTTTQNALSTTAELVIAANTSRHFAEVKNLDTSITVYLGKDSSLTPANGHGLKAGESFGYDDYDGAIWAVAASGTPNISTIEW